MKVFEASDENQKKFFEEGVKKGHFIEKDGKYSLSERGEGLKEGMDFVIRLSLSEPEKFKSMQLMQSFVELFSNTK